MTAPKSPPQSDDNKDSPAPITTYFSSHVANLRFALGALTVLIGVAVIFDWSNVFDWLFKFEIGDVRMQIATALVYVVAGLLAMLAWHPLGRTAAMVFLLCAGSAGIANNLFNGDVLETGQASQTVMRFSSACLILVMGFRAFFSLRAPRIAVAIDGFAMTVGGFALIGYAFGQHAFYNPGFGLSVALPEAIASFAGSALLTRMTRAFIHASKRSFQPFLSSLLIGGALAFCLQGGAALLDMGQISFVFWAIDSGREFSAEVVRHSFFSGIMLGMLFILMVCFPAVYLARLLKDHLFRRAFDVGFERSRNVIGSVYTGMTMVLGKTEPSLVKKFAKLNTDSSDLSEMLAKGQVDAARLTIQEVNTVIGEITEQFLSATLADEYRDDASDTQRTQFSKIVDAAVGSCERVIGSRGFKVVTHGLNGRVTGNPNILTHALRTILMFVLDRNTEGTPLISIRLIPNQDEDVIRVLCGVEPGKNQERSDIVKDCTSELSFVQRAMDWHGGRFWLEHVSTAMTMNLALPRTRQEPPGPEKDTQAAADLYLVN